MSRYREELEHTKRALVTGALQAHHGNRTQAAQALGISRAHLRLLIIRLGLSAAVVAHRDEAQEDAQRTLVTNALQAHRGNRTQAARALGFSRARLRRLITRLGVSVEHHVDGGAPP